MFCAPATTRQRPQLARPTMLVNHKPSNDICSHPPMVAKPSRSELLRCSILESLRSSAPVSPPSTLASPAIFTESQWSREVGRDTATLTQKQLEALSKEREELFDKHYDNLLFERSVDQIGFSNTHIDQEAVFGALLSSHSTVHEHHPLFALPITVRRRIYDFCFPHESRKISLSPHFATMDTFSDGDLASPWDVLKPVLGGLDAFRELRQELMTYFWTQYHFHVTLNPFTGPKFSPLTLVWLPEYLGIIQFLTVEADFTRFGFGAPSNFAVKKIGFSTLSKGRAEYSHNFVNKTENFLIEIVKGLVKRRGKTTMAEFNLMCRRYVGVRPVDGSEVAACNLKSIPYCSDDSLYLCDAVCDLRGILQKSRVSGFTHQYTQTVVRTIFGDGGNEPNWSLAKDAWPPVPIRTEKFIGQKNRAILSLMDTSPFEPLPLTPTSSFAEDVETELLKYESSIYSEKTKAEHIAVDGGSRTSRSESTCTPADATHEYQECVGSINGSNNSDRSRPRIQGSDPNSGRQPSPPPSTINSRCATPKSHESSQDSQVRFSGDSRRHLLTATPTIGSRSPTPQSPNAMNRRNEQDPAFVRTVDALRSFDDDNKPKAVRRIRPKSMIPSPIRKKEVAEAADRSQTSQGAYPETAVTVRRYLSFVKRLRGRES